MGSAASRPEWRSPHQQHVQHAPMWVVKAADVMEMTGRMEIHQTLRKEGRLSEWSPEMFTIFVSHQWLDLQHPDPSGDQLQVLQGFLRNFFAKKIKIETDIITQYRGSSQILCNQGVPQRENLYIWLDYFSVPQRMGMQTDGLTEGQLMYVHSIPHFVDNCSAFVALVPDATHSEGQQCNKSSWLERGWCRTEFWCHFLSPRAEVPIIVLKSADMACFTMPLWHRYPVHTGSFGVEQDREACRAVIEKALAQRVSRLSLDKSKTAHRLYLALFADMAGLSNRERSMEQFQARPVKILGILGMVGGYTGL